MYVYRFLRAEEYSALQQGKDIMAKEPGYDLPIESHTRRKQKKTPWISASKECYCLLKWIETKPDRAIIRINLDLVSEWYDVSTTEKCLENGVRNCSARNLAVYRREVVIKNIVPNEACEVVIEPYAVSKIFSRKKMPSWKVLYLEYFPKKIPKKKSVRLLIKEIKKQIRPNLSLYRLKKVMQIVAVLDGLTPQPARPWDSTFWVS